MREPTSTYSLPALLIERTERRSRFLDYWEMTKPRLSLMSVITAVVGYLAARPARDLPEFFALLAGTAAAAGGAAVLNEWMERDADARMRRTAQRPIPAGAIAPGPALAFGLALAILGPLVLWWGAGAATAGLGLATLLSYLLLYTPLKRVTPWNTEIGAVPGALPPLMGWVAATGSLTGLGLFLGAVLFLWQIAHFMAISWSFRDDYRRGGFRMLSLDDPTGRRVSRRAWLTATLLLLLLPLPLLLGQLGLAYALLGPALGLWFWREALAFHRAREKDRPARRLFLVSIAVLPALLLAVVLDRFL